MKSLKYYIELVSQDGTTYFQLVRFSDNAILFANASLQLVADKVMRPTWKDGSPVIL